MPETGRAQRWSHDTRPCVPLAPRSVGGGPGIVVRRARRDPRACRCSRRASGRIASRRAGRAGRRLARLPARRQHPCHQCGHPGRRRRSTPTPTRRGATPGPLSRANLPCDTAARRVAFAVCDRLDNNRGYARLATLVEEPLDPMPPTRSESRSTWATQRRSWALATTALAEPTVTRHPGVARFDTVHSRVHTEIRGWTLADSIDDHGFATLPDAAQDQLSDLAAPPSAANAEQPALHRRGRRVAGVELAAAAAVAAAAPPGPRGRRAGGRAVASRVTASTRVTSTAYHAPLPLRRGFDQWRPPHRCSHRSCATCAGS